MLLVWGAQWDKTERLLSAGVSTDRGRARRDVAVHKHI